MEKTDFSMTLGELYSYKQKKKTKNKTRPHSHNIYKNKFKMC